MAYLFFLIVFLVSPAYATGPCTPGTASDGATIGDLVSRCFNFYQDACSARYEPEVNSTNPWAIYRVLNGVVYARLNCVGECVGTIDMQTGQCIENNPCERPPYQACIPFSESCTVGNQTKAISFFSQGIECGATLRCNSQRYFDPLTGTYLSCGVSTPSGGTTTGGGTGSSTGGGGGSAEGGGTATGPDDTPPPSNNDYCTQNPTAWICQSDQHNDIDDYCATHPTSAICIETNAVSDYCQQNPNAAICKTMNALEEYCQQNPNKAICKDGDAANPISAFCVENPTASICVPSDTENGVAAGISKYCQDNPDTAICKQVGNGTASASCETPPACTGDAVQCAILRQQWETMCAVIRQGQGDGSGGDGRSVGGLACTVEPPECKGDVFQCAIIRQQWLSRCQNTDTTGTELGSALDGTDTKSAAKAKQDGTTNNLDLSTRLNTGGFLGRACPANQSFQVLDVQVTLPFADICFALEIMGNVALAMAMLMAARIVFV